MGFRLERETCQSGAFKLQLKPCLFREESIAYKDGIQSKVGIIIHTLEQ